MLAHPCIPEIINLIDKRLFGGNFLPVDIDNYELRYPATVPSIVFNQIDLIEISYRSVGITKEISLHLYAHYQESTTALGASGFTVEEWRLERCWSCSARPRPTMLQQ